MEKFRIADGRNPDFPKSPNGSALQSTLNFYKKHHSVFTIIPRTLQETLQKFRKTAITRERNSSDIGENFSGVLIGKFGKYLDCRGRYFWIFLFCRQITTTNSRSDRQPDGRSHLYNLALSRTMRIYPGRREPALLNQTVFS